MKTDYRQQLKYCPECHQVWEFDRTQGRELKYKDHPSYGLYREICSKCKEVAPKKYVSSDDQTLPNY